MNEFNKSILITGANGYIGGFLLKALVQRGYQKIYCTTSSTSSLDNFLSFKGVVGVHCDIADREMVFGVLQRVRPNYIFHLAAIGTKNSLTQPCLGELIRVNAFGTQNIIDAAIDTGICDAFINVSTAYEYGPQINPILESSLLYPQGNYAISKAYGSVYLEEKIKEIGFPGINYRLFSVYGPDDSERIIPLLLEAFLFQKEIKLSDIYRKRDFVHISTLIAALLEFDKLQKNNINTINIGSGESVNIYELVSIISKLLSCPIPRNIIFEPSEVPLSHWKCDNTLLQTYLPVIIGLDEGIMSIIQS